MPEVSVIIPCFNQGQFIDDAVNSVLNQTFKDLEIIIIDDGSTDPFTINKLQNYNKPNCRIFHTKNRGLAAARNLGIQLANGRFIQLLDSDDILLKDKIELQILWLKTRTIAISYTDYFPSFGTDFSEPCPSRYLSPKFNTKDFINELICNWEYTLSIPCHCFLFPVSVFKNHNIRFNERLKSHEDWECWMNIFSLNPEVNFIDNKLVIYRIHNKSMCFDSIGMKAGFEDAIRVQRKKFRKNSIENKLLTRRMHKLKYDIDTEYLLWVFAERIFRKTKKVFKLSF